MALLTSWLVACNDNKTESTTTTDSTTVGPIDTTHTTTETTREKSAYAPAEGDVIYQEKKVMVRRNGDWVTVDKEVKLDNGTVVYPNGTVRKDDREQELEDGEVVNKSGDFFDRAGYKIDNAWDSTKAGVKRVGKAIGNEARKVGEKIKDAVKDDDHKQ